MSNQKNFSALPQPHILMITNHGIHHWEIVPGLPDTGGQNVFVNQFTASLAKAGFKITIVNRGGYRHPTTGELRSGFHYKDSRQRILFLDDGLPKLVRKEDMDERIPHLSQALQEQLTAEETGVDVIISHYWDGAKLGTSFNRSLPEPVKHIWVPHSLGAVKKRNVRQEEWDNLRIDERIANEAQLITEVDKIAATSATIRQSLLDDYNYQKLPLFLPPCVDPERYHPRTIRPNHPIWEFLSQHAGITPAEIQRSQIITEISRTDTTKRKDVLIKAFAQVIQHFTEVFLVVTIDQSNKSLSDELMTLIRASGIEKRVAVLGSVWDDLPDIYAVTTIYCTPSIMEGFGMTPQEAAATKVPVVSSHLVPFATEYLLGDRVEEITYKTGSPPLKVGAGTIISQADDVTGFAYAIELLLSQENLQEKMGENAYNITIPYFTWDNMVSVFLKDSDITL